MNRNVGIVLICLLGTIVIGLLAFVILTPSISDKPSRPEATCLYEWRSLKHPEWTGTVGLPCSYLVGDHNLDDNKNEYVITKNNGNFTDIK